MALNTAQIKALKPKDKPYKVYDGKGLFLLVKPTGNKLWRFRYKLAKKEKLLSFGACPEISLREARDQRDIARKQIRDGIDPSRYRKGQDETKDSFELIAREWFDWNSPSLVDTYRAWFETLSNACGLMPFRWL